MSDVPLTVKNLAKECAQHRVVPFLGAGCSARHLGVDWDDLGREMASSLGTPYSGDNIEIASHYVKRFGRTGLARLLETRLRADRFDPTLGSIHLSVLGLNLGTLYTTNQDNLIELCHSAYGRPLTMAVDVDDIARLTPGDSVLYKFHGDLNKPDSIVFCREDYAERGPLSINALDIRLRSDALGKNLLFLGYSFRDPNVRAMFAHLKELFGGRIPTSYLVQYGSDPAFAEMLRNEFGIEAIDCTKSYPDSTSPDEALSRFFGDLCSETVGCKTGAEIQDLFRPRVPSSRRVALAHEISALSAKLPQRAVADGITLFRSLYDQTLIPPEFQEEVVGQLAGLCERADCEEHAHGYAGVLFNLKLRPDMALSALAYCMTGANLIAGEQFAFGSGLMLRIDSVPDEAFVVAVALAIAILREWGRPLTAGFYSWVAFIDGCFPDVESLPEDTRNAVKAVFADAYRHGATTYENPIVRQRRLGAHGSFFRSPSGRSLHRDLLSMLPKRLSVPYRKS